MAQHTDFNLNDYFDSLVFEYVGEKQNYAMYCASIASQLAGNVQRFVIAFVPKHLGIQSKARLSELSWKNLQMRLCPKYTYNVPTQRWVAPDIDGPMLNVINRNQKYTTYQAEGFPYEVLMLHSNKKKSIYQYPNRMNIHWAIDQFSTIFNAEDSYIEYV